MFNIFNSSVLIEIGEAIGNIGKRLRRHSSHAEALDEAYHSYMQNPIRLHLPDKAGNPVKPSDNVIEGTFRVIDEEDDELKSY